MKLSDDDKLLLRLIEKIVDRNVAQPHTPRPGAPFAMPYTGRLENLGIELDESLGRELQRALGKSDPEHVILTLESAFRRNEPVRSPNGLAMTVLRNDIMNGKSFHNH